MSVTHAADMVAMATEKGRTTSLTWRNQRYLITDTPPPLRGGEVLHDALTHPLVPPIGWRFQATSAVDPGDVRMLGVVRDGERWELLAAYE